MGQEYRLRGLGLVCALALGACGTSQTNATSTGAGGTTGVMPVSLVIGPAGGKVFASDGTSVEFPPGALAASTTITLTPDPTAPAPDGAVWVGTPFDFGPEGTQFAKPVTVTMIFSPNSVPKKDPQVVVETAPAGSTSYTSLGGTLTDATHVSAPTTHFSIFGPAAEPPAGGTTTGGGEATTGTASGGTGTGGATGTAGGTSGGTGTSTGGSSTGSGSTAGPFVCPSIGAVGCGTLGVQNGPYGNFVHDGVCAVTLGTFPGPAQNVPAIVLSDGTFGIQVALPTCPTGPGVVMESGWSSANLQGATQPIPFTASVDFLEGDGGLVGTIVGGSGWAIEGTFAFPSSLGAAGACVPPSMPPTVFGPPSICSAALDAGCTGTTDCAQLPDGGQPTGTGTLTIPAAASSPCLSTYAPIPVNVTLGQPIAEGPVEISASALDGGTWQLGFDLSCCPNGLGTLPVTAYFDVNGCGVLSTSPQGFDGLLTVESLDGGLAGNLYANGVALYFSFDPSFTTPLDAGPAGSLYGSCYPCQSSGDDGGTAAACARNGDCCEGNCVIDAGTVGLCQ